MLCLHAANRALRAETEVGLCSAVIVTKIICFKYLSNQGEIK